LKLNYDQLVSSFAFNFNLRRYTTGDFDGVVILWNVESGAVRHRLVPPPLPSATPSTSGRPDYAPRSDRAAECLSFIDGGRALGF